MRFQALAPGLLALAFDGVYATEKGSSTPAFLAGILPTASPSPVPVESPVKFGQIAGAPKSVLPIVAADYQVTQSLGWTLSSSVTVQLVELTNKASGAVFARWDLGSVRTTRKADPRGLSIRQSDIVHQLSLNADHNNIIFDIDASWSANFEASVYANVTWHNNTLAGYQTSSEFAIAKDSNSVEEAFKKSGIVLSNIAPGTSDQWTIPSITTSPTQGTTTATASPEASPASVGQTGGLSGGVIAGIVIGAVAGIALIVGLVWFFCFRRPKQQNQSREMGYRNDAGAAAMIADKEQPGISESSPHSAYGDDGGRLHDRGSVVVDPSYMPYSDHAPQGHNTSPTTHAAIASHGTIPLQATGGTQSTSQDPSTRYAHLVEEGMTPEEIRRLEEEEHALDQAIDAAGHNRTGAGGAH